MSLFRPIPPQSVKDFATTSFGGASSPFSASSSSESFGARSADDPDYEHLGLNDEPEEEDVNMFGDIAQGVLSGASEAVRSGVGLLDMVMMDVLPDEWHEDPYFDKPQGTAGQLASGLTQFATGFFPAFGALSLLGKAGKAASIFKFSEKTAKGLKGFSAGAIADFAAFDGHEQRLSNMLAGNVGAANTVAEYLQADEDDDELEGRLKNVIEGAMVGGAIGGVIAGIKHLKAIKKYDGSPEAAAKVEATKHAKDAVDVIDGNATEAGIKSLGDVKKAVEELDPEDAVDTHVPDEGVPDAEGLPDVSKLQAPISGPQALYQNKYIVTQLSSGESLEELEDVMADIVPKLLAKETRTKEALAASMIQLAELRGMDSAPIAKAIRMGLLDTDRGVELMTEAALIQQVAFAGSKLSFDRTVGYALQLEELIASGAKQLDIDELTLLAESETKRLEFFTAKQASIGTGASDIFRGRQARNIEGIQSLIGKDTLDSESTRLLDDWEKASAIDADDVGLEALNDIRIRKIDEEVAGTLKDMDDVTPVSADDLGAIKDKAEGIAAKRTKEIGRLQKQLDQKRRRSQKINEMSPEEIKGTAKDPGKPDPKSPEVEKLDQDIRLLRDQIKHHDQAFKDEQSIITLREEEYYIDSPNVSDAAYQKRLDAKQASLERLRKLKATLKPGEANSAVKQLKELLKVKGAAKGKRAKAAKQLDAMRRDLLDGKVDAKGKPLPASLKNDPELQLIYDKITSARNMLKEENSIQDVIKEVQELSELTDTQFLTLQRTQAARNKRLSNPKTALADLRKQRNEYIKNRNESINNAGTGVTTKRAYADWLKSRPGDKEKGFKKYMERVIYAADSETPLAAFQQGDELAKMSGWRKFGNLGARLFQRNLISGASTLTVNVGIPQTMKFLKRMELIVGSGIRRGLGDPDQKAVFDEALGLHGTVADDLHVAIRAAAKGARTQSDVVTGGASPFMESTKGAPMDAMDPRIWGVDENTTGGKALKWAGTYFNWPFAANAGGDAGNKAHAAIKRLRMELRVHLKTDKNWSTKPPEAQEAWVASMMKKAISRDGELYNESRLLAKLGKTARDNIINKKTSLADNPMAIADEHVRLTNEAKDQFINDQNVLDIVERTKEYAQEITATSPMKNEVINMINRKRAQYPPLTLLLPFVNTPANILQFGLQRTPFGAMAELVPRLAGKAAERRAAVAAMSPIQRAEFSGRLATASAGGTTLLYYAYLNQDKITGSGPRNPDERKALEATGWKPNSFIFGDEDNPTYVSYQRLDPWATMIGIAADIATFGASNPDLEPGSMDAVGSLMFTISEGITDKSFLRGLNNVINMVQQPEVYFGKGVRDVVSGLTVPQSLAQMKNLGEAEVLLRESRTVVDAILRKMPIAEEFVAPKRTFLGEAIYKQNPLGLLGVMNPVYISSKKNDSVDKTILELIHGFGMPSANYLNHKDTDMRQFYNEEGRQAYDRYMELSSEVKINGRTMRDSLKGLVNSRQFKAIAKTVDDAGGSSTLTSQDPRIGLMNKTMSQYRLKAKSLVIQEFPELLKTLKTLSQQKRDIQKSAMQEFNNPIPTQ